MAEYKPSKPGIVFGLATAALAGYMGLVGCTRSDLPTPTVYNSPTPTKTPTPTATYTPTLEDIATDTPTPSSTPTPETIGGPSPFVIAYGFNGAPCGLDENLEGYLVLGPGCYHVPQGDVPLDEVALEDKLNAPLGGTINLRVFNPNDGAELYELDSPVGLNEFNAQVYHDKVNDEYYMLCGAPSIEKLGDYVCKVGVISADMENGEIQVPVEITVPVTITDGNGGNGGNGGPNPTLPPKPTPGSTPIG